MQSGSPSPQPAAGPSATRSISGTSPGLLDPSQLARVLRSPASTLLFASFDPHTASSRDGISSLSKLSLKQERPQPRVVVETASSGASFWRFVPKARMDEGVADEGTWPRVVSICGELVECTQDQWDIYKLDPFYDCLVRASPALSIISPAVTKAYKIPPESQSIKRRAGAAPPLNDEEVRPPTSKKKKRQEKHYSSNDEEGDEVEEMVIDDDGAYKKANAAGQRVKRSKSEKEAERQRRREKLARRVEKLGVNGDGHVDFNFAMPHSKSLPPESSGKRKAASLHESLRKQSDCGFIPDDETENRQPSSDLPFKRTRTVPPSGVQRVLNARRLHRRKQKQDRLDRQKSEWRHQRDQQFMGEVLAEVPEYLETDTGPENGFHREASETINSSDSESDDSDEKLDEEAVRQAAIAESRRKLAELEADRPLWEQEARKRAMRELAEEEARRAKVEERRRAEARRAEEEGHEREEREARQREENLRREREEAARRERDRRQRQRYATGPWTPQRALERYRMLSDAFDSAKFSPNDPLTFDAVPWPVLHSPVALTVEDIDWEAVEAFFQHVKPHMRTQDYKPFVEKSHRRFHPDRWSSRNIWRSIADDSERQCLEAVVNTVSQAVTGIWQQATGRG